MDKQELRRLIRERKRRFTTQELQSMSSSVVRRLLAHPQVKAAGTVMCYYSLPDEVDTHGLVDELRRQGKRVLLPVVLADGQMELREYTGTESMNEDQYHILEPSGAPFTRLDDIDVALIPGMSFDDVGHRLGRGKGYYDRFLCRLPQLYKIGVCFDFQKMKKIPHDAHDVMMDEII